MECNFHTIANRKLNAKWLAHSAFQADPIGFEYRQLHQCPRGGIEQTHHVQTVARSDSSVRVQVLPGAPIMWAKPKQIGRRL